MQSLIGVVLSDFARGAGVRWWVLFRPMQPCCCPIKNVGTEELVTLFWAHELFNPEAPDTYPEPVMIIPEDHA